MPLKEHDNHYCFQRILDGSICNLLQISSTTIESWGAVIKSNGKVGSYKEVNKEFVDFLIS